MKKNHLNRIIPIFNIFTWGVLVIVTGMLLTSKIYAQMQVPESLQMITSTFVPPMIKGLIIHPESPFEFDFIFDSGEAVLDDEEIGIEADKLIKYFLASLTIPEQDLWVNLSPDEPDRIIADGFAVTEMGKVLLAQDYLLKQVTSSLMHPDSELGQVFWDRVYKLAYEKFGTTDIPVDTLSRVWIIPQKAKIYENGDRVFVTESHLRVMLEKDYLNLQTTALNDGPVKAAALDDTSDLVRQIIIPELEREVNEGEMFAPLRQVYNSFILAAWYKRNLKESILNKAYSNQRQVNGLETEEKNIKEKIYQQYLTAFRDGAYDFIKEEYDPKTQDIIPRKYFSGGILVKSDFEMDDAMFYDPQAIGKITIISSKFIPSDESMLDEFTEYVDETERTSIADVNYGAMLSDKYIEQVNQALERYGYPAAKVVNQGEIMLSGDGIVNVGFRTIPLREDPFALLNQASYEKNMNFFILNEDKKLAGNSFLFGHPFLMFKNGLPYILQNTTPTALDYIIDFGVDNKKTFNQMKIPTAEHLQSGPYMRLKDVTMMELEKQGVRVPKWLAFIHQDKQNDYMDFTEQASVFARFADERKKSNKVQWIEGMQGDLKQKIEAQLQSFLKENDISQGVAKTNDGYGGYNIVFFDASNVSEKAQDVVALINLGFDIMVQERILPPMVKKDSKSFDYNFRVFVSPGQEKGLAKIVRFGEEGESIGFSQGARGLLIEELAHELGLSLAEREQLEVAIDQESIKAFLAINGSMADAGILKQNENATDFMGVDIIVRQENGVFVPYIIELNGFRSGGLWDLDVALKEVPESILSKEKATARLGEAAAPYVKTILARAQKYSDQAMLSNQFTDQINRALLEFGYPVAKVVDQYEIMPFNLDMINIGVRMNPVNEKALVLLNQASAASNVNFFMIDMEKRIDNYRKIMAFPKLIFKDGQPYIVDNAAQVRIDYLIDFDVINKPLFYSKVPMAEDLNTGPYLRLKDVTMLELEKRGVNVPRWLAFIHKGRQSASMDFENQKSVVDVFTEKREQSDKVKWVEDINGDLRSEVENQLKDFLSQNNISQGVAKTNDGSGGENIIFFNENNLTEKIADIVRLIQTNNDILVQERIMSPMIERDQKVLDYNFRVFMSPGQNGKLAKVVRIGQEGTAINIMQDAKAMLVEELAKELGLSEQGLVELEKKVDDQMKKSFQAITAAMINDNLLASDASATDFMTADILIQKEAGVFVPYVIELNGFRSGGLWALQEALKNAAENSLSKEEADARAASVATPYVNAIINHAQKFRDQAMLSSNNEVAEYGGIDFNPQHLELESEGNKIDFILPVNAAESENIIVNGLIPVIFKITPIESLPVLLGNRS